MIEEIYNGLEYVLHGDKKYRRFQVMFNHFLKKTPLKLFIELTNDCNAHCTTCLNKDMKRKRGVMDFDFFKKLVDVSCTKKIGYVHLYGVGESYIVSNVEMYFDYAIKKYSEYGVDTILTSNGEIISQIPSGISEVLISFNAGKKETYERITGLNFNKTLQNIYRLNETGQLVDNVTIRMLVSEETESEVDLFYDLFKHVDAHIELSYKYDNQHNAIDNKTIKKLAVKYDNRVACNYVTRGINVCWNGNVILCPHDFEGEICFGNLYNQTWDDILNSELRKKILNEHNNLIFTNLCKNCNYNVKYKAPFIKKLK